MISFRGAWGWVAFALIACSSSSHGHERAHEENATGALCVQDKAYGVELTYERFGADFMNAYCVGCHSSELKSVVDRLGAPSDMNFDDIESIRAMADVIDEHAAAGPAAVNGEMPPGDWSPAPTDEERSLLGVWLACGAP